MAETGLTGAPRTWAAVKSLLTFSPNSQTSLAVTDQDTSKDGSLEEGRTAAGTGTFPAWITKGACGHTGSPHSFILFQKSE